MFRYLPEQASEFAPSIDRIHNLITDLSVFFTVAIVGTMIYFAIRYRRRNGVDHETPQIEGSVFLEMLWTIIPTLISIVVAAYGVIGYNQLRDVPKDALEIQVVGQKWNWSFQYENGKKSANEFFVPVDTPVKLIITSTDVLHSFFVPGMRTKVDAVPGLFTYQWFKPVKTGTQQVYCTEYCGTNHSNMLAKMHVVSRAEFDRWVAFKERVGSPAEEGRKTYTSLGCNACHSLDGSRLVGPSFLKVFGREGRLADGTSYVVDENYIRESILNPELKIVEGYSNVMPSFQSKSR
jgi:cytochrome c oxidase subunit II